MPIAQRNINDIQKMLANYIIKTIHDTYTMEYDNDWMQIGPITEECQNELKLILNI